MTKEIKIPQTGSDGASSSFVSECFVRAWRALLHNDKKARNKALRGIIDSGNNPHVLTVFMNKKGLGQTISPQDLVELGQIANLPTVMEFKFGDHTQKDG
jgi:hypothetical protein